MSPIRYAVVGLGHIAQVAVLPAFANTKHSQLTALVTGDRKKAAKLGRYYKVPVYSYDQYEDLLNSDVADALYICLPNHLHTRYAVPALRKGLHVLCEKPLALTSKEVIEIRKAAQFSGAKAMTAYRLHFEPSNLKALELCRSGKLGDLRYFSSCFSYQVGDAGNIRLQAKDGGGPLWDIGIYCINAARTLFEAEPTEVFAYAAASEDKRFREVEEMASVIMRFPNQRLASFTCSFGSDTAGAYEIYGTKGGLRLKNAYEYATTRELNILKHGQLKKTINYPKVDQFAPEIEYFTRCIRTGQEPEPSVTEGLADVHVLEAIFTSIRTGRPTKVKPLGQRKSGPSRSMARALPVQRQPRLVDVVAPSGE